MIHVLIDDDSITPGREGQVREAMRLLAAELAPGDMLGVLTTQGQINFRPSTDLVKVKQAVDGFAGRGGTSETEADAQCRTTHVLAALGSMLALTGGTPTTIVVFSGGLAARPEDHRHDQAHQPDRRAGRRRLERRVPGQDRRTSRTSASWRPPRARTCISFT